LKIAICSPYDFSFPGGVQSHILEFSKELIIKGHEVTIFAPLSNKNIHEAKYVNFYNLGKTLAFSFLGSKPRITLNVFKMISCIKFIKKNKFDIVHLHEPLIPSQIIINLFISKKKLIGTFHSYGDKNNYVYIYFNKILSYFIKRLSIKICVSKFSQLYIKQYFSFDSIIIPNGININNFSKSTNTPKILDNNFKKILFVGRFDEERKGFKILLKTFYNLKKKFTDLNLIVVGPGNKDKLKKYFIPPNHDKDIEFLGNITQEKLPDYYKNVDLVCVPSTGNESFGIVLLEAMASGSILIASSIESYKYLLVKNNYGFMYNANSDEELGTLIEKILLNELSTEENVNNGLKNVQNYSWEKLVSEIINIYNKL
jgi:phosphatidylinositol alpha-mannosyltransferase|tara:strand:- start:690 stop:1802 length:1113 start_codon:yes stop_codon:yes gene_type:complete